MTDNRAKHLTILQNLYSGDRVLIESAARSRKFFEDGEQEAFDAFQVDVGNVFLELKDELDQGLEDLADVHPEETDPRKWTAAEWKMFEDSIVGHEFQEIYRTMAHGQPNIHLIWEVIEDRLNLP